MGSTQPFNLTLPNEIAQLVRAKVAAGEYATESKVSGVTGKVRSLRVTIS